MQQIKLEAQDNLLTANVEQAHQANKSQMLNFPFWTGDHIVLSTQHWSWEYKSGNEPGAAKFMPCFDGPYHIMSTD